MSDLEAEEARSATALERLAKLSEASLRINESLELEDILQGVMDSARALTGARYAIITTLDESGQMEELRTSGLTVDEARRIWEIPGGAQLFAHLSAMSEPLRLSDLPAHANALGLTEFSMPVNVIAFLGVPLRHRGRSVGHIHLANESTDQAFSQEDEDTLVLFASQVALVVANARRYREQQRAKANLETLIDTSPVGVVVIDMPSGTAAWINREARRIVAGLCDPSQQIEQLLDVISVQRADGGEISLLDYPLAEALRMTEPVRAEQIVLTVPDGRSTSVLLNASPIRTEAGDLDSVVVTIQDLTTLEEQERMRTEFLGMVSHELRMPLASIWGSVVAMLEDTEDLDPAEMRQFLRIILDQASSMRELIGDLLDVARIETGTLPILPEPADLAKLVDRARNNFSNGGGRSPLEIDLPPDLPLVMADRRRIVQVIGNLLNNAARHSPDSAAIRVSAARQGVHVEVSVTDAGRGIPNERLPHLFRKFTRHEDDDPGGDTGLGLAICKGIVEAHGGRIRAESDGPGLGARFVFSLPAVAELPAEPPQPAVRTQPQASPRETILVLDDDPRMLRFVRHALVDAGFDAVVIADPEELFSTLEEHRPDLVLLDLMLPGAEGISLLRDLQAVADVPVIFISVYGRDQIVAEAFESGAADYLVKPFSGTELVARIRAAIRSRSSADGPVPRQPYVFRDLTVDYNERRVSFAGRPLELRAKEYQLLYELSVNAGRVVTHDQLLRRIWGARRPNDLRALRTHLRRLRSKLGEDGSNPTYFFAEPRVGYRMAKGEGDQT